MPDVSDKQRTGKEQTAEAIAIADRIERIRDALGDIAGKETVSGRAAEQHLVQAQDTLTDAIDDLEPDRRPDQ